MIFEKYFLSGLCERDLKVFRLVLVMIVLKVFLVAVEKTKKEWLFLATCF